MKAVPQQKGFFISDLLYNGNQLSVKLSACFSNFFKAHSFIFPDIA